MDDIELTQKIKNAEWIVDFDGGTVQSEIAHYRIVPSADYVDLKGEWLLPELDPSPAILLGILRSTTAAYQEAVYCRKTGRPTTAEIKAFKKRHNMTGARIALLCGLKDRAVRNWLHGNQFVPPACWRLLRILLGEATPDEIIDEAKNFIKKQ